MRGFCSRVAVWSISLSGPVCIAAGKIHSAKFSDGARPSEPVAVWSHWNPRLPSDVNKSYHNRVFLEKLIKKWFPSVWHRALLHPTCPCDPFLAVGHASLRHHRRHRHLDLLPSSMQKPQRMKEQHPAQPCLHSLTKERQLPKVRRKENKRWPLSQTTSTAAICTAPSCTSIFKLRLDNSDLSEACTEPAYQNLL